MAVFWHHVQEVSARQSEAVAAHRICAWHCPNQPNALRERHDITPPFSLTTGER
jgi:hypothetical protein